MGRALLVLLVPVALVAKTMRAKLGASTAAHAVAIAFRRGILR